MRRLRSMLMNKCKLLLFSPFVAAVFALLLGGIGPTYAGQNKSEKEKPKNSHEYYRIRDPKVDPKFSQKERARVQRDAAIKNRDNTRKYIHAVMEGKQPAVSQGGGAK